MSIRNVGFIGMGNIGRPMARNLAAAGFAVRVFDVDAAAVAELVSHGATAVSTPAAMAAVCEAVCLCVRDDAQVDQVLNGADGIFGGARPGLYVLIHSTVTAAALRRWQQQADSLGVVLIDASISGGPAAVNARNLCYMVGASDVVLDVIRPLLVPSSDRGGAVVHAGPVGTGLVLKLANNTMASFAFAAIHEAAKMVEAGGGSVAKLLEVGAVNGVVTGQMKSFIESRATMTAQYSEDGFRGRFRPMALLIEKDMHCAVQTAGELGVAVPASSYIHGIIRSVFLNEY